jgi:hypothetical protein
MDQPALLGIVDHGHANPVFDRSQRIEEFALQEDGRLEASRDFVQANQGRVTDGFNDVIVDTAHSGAGRHSVIPNPIARQAGFSSTPDALLDRV